MAGHRQVITTRPQPSRAAWQAGGDGSSDPRTPRASGRQWQQFLHTQGLDPSMEGPAYDPQQPIHVRQAKIVEGHRRPCRAERVKRGDLTKWQAFLDDDVIIKDVHKTDNKNCDKDQTVKDDNNNRYHPRSKVRLNNKAFDETESSEDEELDKEAPTRESLFLSKNNGGKEVWRINKIQKGSENVYRVTRASFENEKNDNAKFLMNIAQRFNPQMMPYEEADIPLISGGRSSNCNDGSMNNDEIKAQFDPLVNRQKQTYRVLQSAKTLGSESSCTFDMSSARDHSLSGGTVTLTPMSSHVDSRVTGRTNRGQIMRQEPCYTNENKGNKYESIVELDMQRNKTHSKSKPSSATKPNSQSMNSQHATKSKDCSKTCEDLTSIMSVRLVDHKDVESMVGGKAGLFSNPTRDNGCGDTLATSLCLENTSVVGKGSTKENNTTKPKLSDARRNKMRDSDIAATEFARTAASRPPSKSGQCHDSSTRRPESRSSRSRPCRESQSRHSQNRSPHSPCRKTVPERGQGDSKSQHVDSMSKFSFRPISPEILAPDLDSLTTMAATKMNTFESLNTPSRQIKSSVATSRGTTLAKTISEKNTTFKDPISTTGGNEEKVELLENTNNNMALFDTPYEQRPRIKTSLHPSPTSCTYYSDSEADANVGRDVHKLRRRMSKRRHQTQEAIKILSKLGTNDKYARFNRSNWYGDYHHKLGSSFNVETLHSKDKADIGGAQDSSNNNKNRKTTTVSRSQQGDKDNSNANETKPDPDLFKFKNPMTFQRLNRILQDTKTSLPSAVVHNKDVNCNYAGHDEFDILKNVDADVETSSPYIGQFLHKLWRTQCFCDVKVQVGDQCFLAHKLVLAAFSEVFYPTEPQPQPSVCFTIPNSTPEAVFQIFRYLYTSSMDLRDDILEPVMAAAIFMGITEVIEVIKDLFKNPTVDNVAMYVNTQRQFGIPAAITDYPHIIRENFLELARSADFLALGVEDMEKLLQDPDVLVDTENDTIEVLSAWVEFNMHDRACHIGRLLRYLNFEAIAPAKIATLQETYPHIFCTRDGMETISAAFKYHALKNIGEDHGHMTPRGDQFSARAPSSARPPSVRPSSVRAPVASASEMGSSDLSDNRSASKPAKSNKSQNRVFANNRRSKKIRDTRFYENEEEDSESESDIPGQATFRHRHKNRATSDISCNHCTKGHAPHRRCEGEYSDSFSSQNDAPVKVFKSPRSPHRTQNSQKPKPKPRENKCGFRGKWKRIESGPPRVVQFDCGENSSELSYDYSPNNSCQVERRNAPKEYVVLREVTKKRDKNSSRRKTNYSPKKYTKETLI